MKAEIRQKLLQLNQAFYDGQADSFAASRVQPQPGFYRLVEELPQPCASLLDVGCGDGRFGRFLLEQQAISRYTGVDFSAELLAMAQSSTQGEFVQRDMSQRGCLAGLGPFTAVACLAALQHVPGRANRVALLQEMKECLGANGRILLSTWQFTDSPRQRRKIRDWAEVGLSSDDVEPHDYLLTWQRGGFSYRYVCLIDEAETAVLAQSSNLQIVTQFRSDGQEGNLSLYTVLQA
jgi:2-polyprenyl-3-methyl-5-hydroxy-6-metoxy-1,4-benzoquinol methylase